MLAEWLASSDNALFTSGILGSHSSIIELGCGISALTGLTVAPLVSRYILTDQPYVAKLVEQNLEENRPIPTRQPAKPARKAKSRAESCSSGNVGFVPLDWEADEPAPSLTGSPDIRSFDAVIACDCIYNDALVQPLVQTCIDICRLRAVDTPEASRPCLCIVAQQLRSSEVFEAWLQAFHAAFQVWRVPDSMLIDPLRSGSGFAVHIGVLRDSLNTIRTS